MKKIQLCSTHNYSNVVQTVQTCKLYSYIMKNNEEKEEGEEKEEEEEEVALSPRTYFLSKGCN
jgi:hypothetical protein